MKLKKARVQNYWSIHDTGWFNLEDDKTVIVAQRSRQDCGVAGATDSQHAARSRRRIEPAP